MRSRLPLILTGVWILVFFLLAGRYIRLPGLQYDETLFVNAALGGIDDSFIHKRFYGIPVMLMPYIGALKAYLYFPVFKLFGVSPETIRIPAIVLSCVTLWVSFLVSRTLFNPWLGSLFVAVMATDPAFVFSSKLDWGPTVIMVFLKMLCLYLFLKLVFTVSASYLWILLAVLLLGVYDKSNFMWFLLALLLAAIMLYRNRILMAIRKGGPTGLVFLLLFSSVLLMVLAYSVLSGLEIYGSDQSLIERFSYMASLYKRTMDGRAIFEVVTASPFQSPTYANHYSVLSLLVVAVCSLRQRRRSGLKSFCFLALTLAMVFLQMVFTPQAGGPHHVLMLYPLHHLLTISAAFIFLSSFVEGRSKAICTFLVVLALSPLVFSQLTATREYLNSFRKGDQFSDSWSPEIYDLARYLRQNDRKVDFIISVDWGIHNQVFALAESGARKKYLDLWPPFNELHKQGVEQRQWISRTFFEHKSVFVLLHSEDASMMDNVRENFLSFATGLLTNVNLAHRFHLFEVYLVDNRSRSLN